jgi:hypothetical protein
MKAVTTILCLLLAAAASAQDKPAPPAKSEQAPGLTQAQQDQFTIAVLMRDNTEKALRLASVDYQKASEALEVLVRSLQVPGYELKQDPKTGKLEYAKVPEPPKAGETSAAAPKGGGV